MTQASPFLALVRIHYKSWPLPLTLSHAESLCKCKFYQVQEKQLPRYHLQVGQGETFASVCHASQEPHHFNVSHWGVGISEERERARLAVCSLWCKRTYCLELGAAWSWAWSTGCASSLPAADGAATLQYLQGKMKRQKNKCAVQMVARGVALICALSRPTALAVDFMG